MDSDDSTASRFLARFADTINARDFAAHMDLISGEVQIHGLPGFDAIGYEEWARQCKHELDTGILDQISYAGLRLLTDEADRQVFATVETVRASDGSINTMGLELTIAEEPDGTWRLTRERILSGEELEALDLSLE